MVAHDGAASIAPCILGTINLIVHPTTTPCVGQAVDHFRNQGLEVPANQGLVTTVLWNIATFGFYELLRSYQSGVMCFVYVPTFIAFARKAIDRCAGVQIFSPDGAQQRPCISNILPPGARRGLRRPRRTRKNILRDVKHLGMSPKGTCTASVKSCAFNVVRL